MSIVRSLLISIGFQVNTKEIKKADKGILGFKSRFLALAGIANFVLRRVVGVFNAVADSAINASNLAKTLGVSLQDIIAITNAAKTLGIDEKSFQGILTTVNKLTDGLKYGLNDELKLIAKGLGFDVAIEDNALDVLFKILEGLSKIESETDRIFKANLFFGGFGPELSNISKNLTPFRKLIKSNLGAGKEIQDNIDAVNAYKDAVNELSVAWDNFVFTISKFVIPVLKSLFEYLTGVAQFYKGVFTLDLNEIKKSERSIGKAIAPLTNVTQFALDKGREGLNFIKDKSGSLLNSIGNFLVGNTLSDEQRNDIFGLPTITNNIQVDVPVGTTQEQATFISDQISQRVEESIFNTFKRIQQNNPLVE